MKTNIKEIIDEQTKEHRNQETREAIANMMIDGADAKKIVELLKWQFDITMEKLVEVIMQTERELANDYKS